MLSYRLGTVNDFVWEFKPVLSYSKLHTFSTFFGEEKEWKKCIYSLQPGHLEAKQNDRKVKRSKIKQKWVKRENSKYKRLLPVKIIKGPRQNGQC